MGAILLALSILAGQAAAAAPPALSPVLDAKADVGALKIELAQRRSELRAASAEIQSLRNLVQVLIQAQTAADNEKLNADLLPIERELVAALGGDYDKGDRFDFKTKQLVPKR